MIKNENLPEKDTANNGISLVVPVQNKTQTERQIKYSSYVTECYNARELNGISTEFGSVGAVNVRLENIYYICIY